MLFWLYVGSIVGLLAGVAGAVALGTRRQSFQPFTTLELATAAILICLLYVAVIPWQIALAHLPGPDALVFAIPYTTVLLLGLSLAPKPGFATLLIVGQGVLGQFLGRGINPAWWPYYLWCSLGVEFLVIVARGRVKSLAFMLAAGVLRGMIADTYMYLILAPFLWHKSYAPWYVAGKMSLELVGCIVGALLAWRLAPTIEKASRHSAI